MLKLLPLLFFTLLIQFSAAQLPHQKSLIIVFDGTGSMSNNLAQLKPAIKDIVNKFASDPNRPIYNYILTVFNDPHVEPTISSVDPNVLLNGIDKIRVNGGGDEDEMSITGLKHSLTDALDNSVVFLISDAPAKDYYLEAEVAKVIQAKQITANFIIEEKCENNTKPKCQVYCNLAKISGGNCFNMVKNDLEKILSTVGIYLKYEKIGSQIGKGPTQFNVTFDITMEQICIGITGTNPILSVRGINSDFLKLTSELSLSGYRFGCIEEPIPGTYIIIIDTVSEFQANWYALSKITFHFGFSLTPVTSHSETNMQPLTGYKTILSVFPSNSSLIRTLSNVKLIKADKTFVQLNLKKIHDGAYSTDAFDVPTQLFKIHLSGEGKSGFLFFRDISNFLSAVSASLPKVTVESTEIESCPNDEVELKCKVKSQIPIRITWSFGGEPVKEVYAEQSKELVLKLNSLEPYQKGAYICTAKNDQGSATKQINLNIIDMPTVEIDRISRLRLIENHDYSLKCKVNGNENGLTIQWMDGEGNILKSDSKTYNFKALRIHHNKPISCQAKKAMCSTKDTQTYEVANIDDPTSPIFKKDFFAGQAFELECPYAANPSANIQWLKNNRVFEPAAENLEVDDDGQVLFASRATSDHTGRYACLATINEVPEVAHFEVFVYKLPDFSDKIVTVKAKKGSDAVLECLTDVTPTLNIRWLKSGTIVQEGGKTYTVSNVQDFEDYACSVFNRFGAVQKQFKIELEV